MSKISLDAFTKIDTYEDYPCDTPLCVWTGDGFEVEYVDMSADDGSYYPMNGVEFTHYIELPETHIAETAFDD